jgi:hypothetical protein
MLLIVGSGASHFIKTIIDFFVLLKNVKPWSLTTQKSNNIASHW